MGQMSILGASVGLLLLINFIGATVIPLRQLHFSSDRYSESSLARAAGEEYRLPITVTPDLYIITLTPDYKDFANFTGEVEIIVTAKTDGDSISLHYNDMIILERKVTNSSGIELDLDNDTYNAYNETTNIYTLNLSNNQKLKPNETYRINIRYIGYLRDDMAGFYRSSYTTADGAKR